jgi:hypothetical protein
MSTGDAYTIAGAHRALQIVHFKSWALSIMATMT